MIKNMDTTGKKFIFPLAPIFIVIIDLVIALSPCSLSFQVFASRGAVLEPPTLRCGVSSLPLPPAGVSHLALQATGEICELHDPRSSPYSLSIRLQGEHANNMILFLEGAFYLAP
ncbi:hypothetical protein AB685_05530 [Bacillus sp. LL01]|nr:hypothetical protein AB685_05530 [Bacillus sp. LL01]